MEGCVMKKTLPKPRADDGGWIVPLQKDERNKLREDLGKAWPKVSKTNLEKFAVSIDRCLAEHKAFSQADNEAHKFKSLDSKSAWDRIQRVAKTAKAFAGAVAALEENERDCFLGASYFLDEEEIALSYDYHKQGATDYPLALIHSRRGPYASGFENWFDRHGKPLDFPGFDAFDTAAIMAGKLAEATKFIPRAKSRSGPKKTATLEMLILRIAEVYARVFGVRPSAVRDGMFARALKVILGYCGEKKKPSEKWLGEILKASQSDAPKPKPGPKWRK